jgi:predicted HicB family RNase H-like nuclease
MDRKVSLTIRFPRSLSDRIGELAEADGVSKNEFIIRAVMLELERERHCPPSQERK